MRRLPTRRRPDFDRLEDKVLLATGTGTIPPAALTYSHDFLPASQADLLQVDASNKNLEIFASRLAQLSSTRADILQYANQVILDDMAAELQGHLLATNKDVILPPDLIGQDATIARQLLTSANTAGFDQAFLTTMAQINTTAIANGNQIATTTTDTDVRTYAQAGAVTDQSHLTGAQNLLNGLASGMGTGIAPTPTNPITVTAADTTYLQSAHSANNFEILTSQIEILTGTNTGAKEYAQKLVFDHTLAENKVLQLANANGVSLSPTLSPDAIASARSLLAQANSGAYDRPYLDVQVPMHRMTQQVDRQEASTTQNSNLREYARSDVATTAVHILAAQQLKGNQLNSLLPPGTNSQDLKVQVRRLNRFTVSMRARLNVGGFSYDSLTRVQFPRQSNGNPLPNPTKAQIREALFTAINGFLNNIADTSSTGGTTMM